MAPQEVSKRVVLSGFTLSSGDLRITDCAATVIVHEVRTSKYDVGWIVQGCSDVHLLDVATSQGLTNGRAPSPALVLLNSTVELARGTIYGYSAAPLTTVAQTDVSRAVCVCRFMRRLLVVEELRIGTAKEGI